MTVKQSTLKVYPNSGALDTDWLEPSRNLIFTSKTQYYRDGELVTCLRTRADTNGNVQRCVLMMRLDEYTPTYSDLNDTDYYVSQFTCKVNLQYVNADCSKDLQLYTTVKATKSVNINGQTYYILVDDYGNNNYGVLPERLTKINGTFSAITPVYKRIASAGAHKVAPNTVTKVQTLEKDSVVNFSSQITIGNTLYYRTTVDTKTNAAKIVPASVLSDDYFVSLQRPRTMTITKDTDSIDPITNQICEKITKGSKVSFSTKINIGGKFYYRAKDTTNNCSIPATDTNG